MVSRLRIIDPGGILSPAIVEEDGLAYALHAWFNGILAEREADGAVLQLNYRPSQIVVEQAGTPALNLETGEYRRRNGLPTWVGGDSTVFELMASDIVLDDERWTGVVRNGAEVRSLVAKIANRLRQHAWDSWDDGAIDYDVLWEGLR